MHGPITGHAQYPVHIYLVYMNEHELLCMSRRYNCCSFGRDAVHFLLRIMLRNRNLARIVSMAISPEQYHSPYFKIGDTYCKSLQ